MFATISVSKPSPRQDFQQLFSLWRKALVERDTARQELKARTQQLEDAQKSCILLQQQKNILSEQLDVAQKISAWRNQTMQ